MGYFLVKARTNKNAQYNNYLLAWALPVGLHALYNFPLFLTEGIYNSGSYVWWIMFLFFMAITFSAIWLGYQLVKRFIADAKEEQEDQIYEQAPGPSVTTFKAHDRFM